jgi:hypothetical protein
MKKTAITPVCVALALFLAFVGVAAFSADYAPGPIVIDDITKATNRYLGVRFSHERHVDTVGLTCVMCHHTEAKGFVSGTPVRCESCHNASSEISFKDAMHRRCVLCHIKKVKEAELGVGAPTGETASKPPVQCLQCHLQRQ